MSDLEYELTEAEINAADYEEQDLEEAAILEQYWEQVDSQRGQE